MSYDFRLFSPPTDEDPLAMAHQTEYEENLSNIPVNPDREALKQRVASALRVANPALQLFPFDYNEIATIEDASLEEVKLKYRHIELNGPDNGNGIQIQLYDNEASVTIPYWHEGANADNAFQEIWNYLRIIQTHTGYVVYDPQLDTILDLNQGYNQALTAYANSYRTMMQGLPAIIKDLEKKQKRWWQFWRK